MEQRIKQRFGKTILEETMARYGIAPDTLRALDGFESFIYECDLGGESFILRISHSLRRSEQLILGEVDWINYLVDGGVSAARALPSELGRLVEPVDDGHGGAFLAVAFARAPGSPPHEVGWTTALYETYGRLLGRMHSLSRDYAPPDPTWQRPQWNDAIMLEVEAYLPPVDTLIAQRFRDLLNYLEGLPKSGETYGLIHQDVHGGNMFVDERGAITVFDFDDCAYSWFVNDIAIVLFYAAIGATDETRFVRDFLPPFLSGYRTECELDDDWLAEIPHFLKLREIDLYAIIHRSFDIDNIDDPWAARYMLGRRERLLGDIPTIDFDFGVLEF